MRPMHGGLRAQKPLISASGSTSPSSVCSATKWTKWHLVAQGTPREPMEAWRGMEPPAQQPIRGAHQSDSDAPIPWLVESV